MALPCDSPFLNRLTIEAFEPEEPAPEDRSAPIDRNPVGAFRGLAYGIAFQAGAAALGFIMWEILRHLL